MPDINYTVRFPLSFDQTINPGHDGIGSDELIDLVIFNMSNVLLTHKGERTFDNDFGVGLTGYIFENMEDDSVLISLQNDIESQLAQYVPYAVINDIDLSYSPDDHGLYVAIAFTIVQINLSDVLELAVDSLGNVDRFYSRGGKPLNDDLYSEIKAKDNPTTQI